MEAAGYSPEDFGEVFEVWPENFRTYLIFRRFESQWNWVSGLGGAARVGLNMSALPVFVNRMQLTDDEYEQLLDDLLMMEVEAIRAMNEKA